MMGIFIGDSLFLCFTVLGGSVYPLLWPPPPIFETQDAEGRVLGSEGDCRESPSEFGQEAVSKLHERNGNRY